jgi:hypothetical protein
MEGVLDGMLRTLPLYVPPLDREQAPIELDRQQMLTKSSSDRMLSARHKSSRMASICSISVQYCATFCWIQRAKVDVSTGTDASRACHNVRMVSSIVSIDDK